jgi:hypothetical protein
MSQLNILYDKGRVTMKKTISMILAALMIISAFAFVGCDKEEQEAALKFGMGVYAYYEEATSAEGENDGSAAVCVTVAAVLVDDAGKIVKVDFDTAENTVAYTSEGKAVANGEFLTKKEKGDSYGMVAWGGATLEWYAQVDALETVLAGKTLEEAKASIVNGYKGTEEVLNAGCTIGISDFILALEKAMTNAADSKATASATLNTGIVTTADEAVDASADTEGKHVLAIDVAAAAVDKDGKVVAMANDAFEAEFTFGVAGEAVQAATAITTKLEKGDSYGMVAWGGAAKEWYQQVEVFNTACEGLTATEISALVVNGYGVDSLKTAGCTIAISGMAQAAVKAATIG